MLFNLTTITWQYKSDEISQRLHTHYFIQMKKIPSGKNKMFGFGI